VALAAPPASLTPDQRNQIRNLAVSLNQLGQILSIQADPGCLPRYQEALGLYQRIGGRQEEAKLANSLGNVYLEVPGLRDLDQAEKWYRRSLSLRADSDQLGQARSLGQLGMVAVGRFDDAKAAGEAERVLLEHLNAALSYYQQALVLTGARDYETRAAVEHQLGAIYDRVGDVDQALRHYQQSLQHEEARGHIYGAGQTRYNIALLFTRARRVSDALLYARAALDNFQQAGPGAAAVSAQTEQLIAILEQRNH
jgi:tetratricopeptide (TPR) repeat protein